MNWSKVKLIFLRELRDQLRDRRTLFMIAVLPVLLYPLMGMTFIKIAQFLQEHPTRVAVLGASGLPSEPRLLEGDRFAATLFSQPDRARLLEIETIDQPFAEPAAAVWAQTQLEQGTYDAVVFFPAAFAEQLATYSQGSADGRAVAPQPLIFFTGAKDRSRAAYERVTTVLDRWRSKVVESVLQERQVPVMAATPFVISNQDVAALSVRQAALWSKVLPFVLILWALTGAFYPAIDLCAGEKERGTLETLLCSPAERVEIVWGKLLTVTLFSMATSLLNLLSMTVTGSLVLSRLQLPGAAVGAAIGPPPLGVMLWMVVALIPLSAMFSALSLALATMARSTKEGQYYLMPLMLVTFPLSLIAVIPTTEINLGNSVIPVTGVMLLLRTAIEGDYLVALKFLLPTTIVTGTCCLLAIQWAVSLFNDESVLFRESERFSVGVWLRHLVRDRGVTPSVAEGMMCGVLLLMLQFFAQLFGPMPSRWSDFVVLQLVGQIALVATPAVIMALMLTAGPGHTLLLRPTRPAAILAAMLLAVCLHPASAALAELLQYIYPINPETLQALAGLQTMMRDVPLWQDVLLLAVVPAICEELAFRGFILSALRHLGSRGMAILVSSIFFGVVHGILQQSMNAFILGLLLGYLAVQTGSLLPSMAFHVVHNSLHFVAATWFTPGALVEHSWLARVMYATQQSLHFRLPIVLVSVFVSGVVLLWFRSLPYCPSPEERLSDALDHQSAAAV